MLHQFMRYITVNPTGKKYWLISYLGAGFTITGLISFYEGLGDNIIFGLITLLTALVGYLCVYCLAMRRNIGNTLGMIANVGEIIVQTGFNNYGLALVPVYNFSSHVIGLVKWEKVKDQQTQKIAVKNRDTTGFISIVIFLLLAFIFIILNRWLTATTDTLTTWLFGLNALVLILGVVAQGTMIMRYKFAWWIWFTYNCISLALNLYAGNYIFAAQSVIYQLNIMVALYEQYFNTHHSTPITLTHPNPSQQAG